MGRTQPVPGSEQSATPRQIRRLMGARTKQGKAVKSGTGQPSHVALWKEEATAARTQKLHHAKVKKHLQKMTVSWLAEQVHKAEDGGPYLSAPLYKLAKAYGNVWDLSQAKLADLLKLEGVGPVGLGRVEEYLTSHQVELKWRADAD